MSDGSVYRCPACGAPADPKAGACAYCAARLQPVRCPWCFEWTDAAEKGCARCGSAPAAPAESEAPLACPSCRGAAALSTRVLGAARLSGCAVCAGVWADSASFQNLCRDRATQTAYLGRGTAIERVAISDPSRSEIRYRPCPVCGELMNRFNFADCSGVILDLCKPHGVWFDADELRRIVEFIRDGGLDAARDKERQSLELERHRLERAANDIQRPLTGFQPPLPDSLASARDLIGFLIGLKD